MRILCIHKQTHPCGLVCFPAENVCRFAILALVHTVRAFEYTVKQKVAKLAKSVAVSNNSAIVLQVMAGV